MMDFNKFETIVLHNHGVFITVLLLIFILYICIYTCMYIYIGSAPMRAVNFNDLGRQVRNAFDWQQPLSGLIPGARY